MQSSFYRRTLPKFILAFVALTVGVFLSRGDTAFAVGTFSANTTVTLSSSATGANADTTFDLNIPSGDYNFSAVVNSTPGAATIKCGPGSSGVGCDNTATPALGDVMGNLSSSSSLGLTNGLCTPFPPPPITFTFLNATVDITDVISPVPQASAGSGVGVLDAHWTDNGASPTATPPWNAAGGWTDATATTVALTPAEQANGLPAQVDDYPSYLNTLFTPDGGSPVQPVARYAGASNVGGLSVMLNLVIFAPDALANAFPAPHAFHDLRGMGYTSIAVLNDPTQPASPSSITDFCTPLGTISTVYGNAKNNPCNGVPGPPDCDTPTKISKPAPGANTAVRYANPGSAGTYLWVSFHQSLRDSDGDGKENAFDPCPFVSDTFDHRTGAGLDGDGDGIPDACDTNPNGAADSDADGWQNRGDNCAQNFNPDNNEAENDTATYAAAAPRGGPRTDGLGDACDPNPSLADGAFATTVTVEPKCIGGIDADGDGWCATHGSNANLNDPSDADANRTPEHATGHFITWVTNWASGVNPPIGEPAQLCNDGADNDGDGQIDGADSGCDNVDIDGDGFGRAREVHVGTNPLTACDTTGLIQAPNPFWPADLSSANANGYNRITIADVTSFTTPPLTRKFGTALGDPNYNQRWDLLPSNTITLADITQLTASANGGTARPSFYEQGGIYPRAFNNPLQCTAIFKP